MPQEFSAFTTKSDSGLLRELANTVTVRHSGLIRKSFQIELNEQIVGAIWDTGATTTSISKKLVEILKLIPIAKTIVHSIHDAREVNVHSVDIILPNRVEVFNLQVTEAANLGKYDVLIGMDIITLGDFAITNANKRTFFSFRYPSDYKHIDYVVEAKTIYEKKMRRLKYKRRKKKK